MTNDSTDRIVAGLREWVAHAPPGAQLPTTRSLSAEHGAGPVTVQRALRQLKALGLIETRPGVGTFVRDGGGRPPVDLGWQTNVLGTRPARYPDPSATQRAAAPDAVALHSGYPTDDLLPSGIVRAALGRAARSQAAVARTPATGMPELQAWFAAELDAASPGTGAVVAHDVLVLAGSQSGLSSIFRAVVGEGEPLVIESPTYWGAIVAAAQARVALVPVPSGPYGPDPDDVERALARRGAKAFYVQPTFANPHGARWSDERSRAVLDVVRASGAFLIEDDWAHDLAIDADPSPVARLDEDGHVIYLRSLTKSVSPALRVAAVIARGPVYERIVDDVAAGTMYVSGVLQAAALDVVSQPAWRTHLRRLRPQLRERRDALVAAVRAHLPGVFVDHVPEGGLNLWVRLPDSTDLDHLVRGAAARGVLIAPGTEWFPAEPSGPHIRLNFSGPHPDRYPQAVAALADALVSAASP